MAMKMKMKMKMAKRRQAVRKAVLAAIARADAIAVVVAVGLAVSCAQAPIAPSGEATVTTPGLLAPANGSQIANLKQPVTLTVNNAFVVDASSAVTYAFDVATDTAFANKVQTQTVAPGNGQTSIVLSSLAPGATYFWRVRATGGSTVGTYSPVGTFAVGPALALAAPAAVAPSNGAAPSGWPTFTITDATRTGPLAQVNYRFDIATSSTFSSVLVTATVPESSGQTSFTPAFSTPVPVGTVLFWRATAIDTPDGISSAASTTQSFTPQAITRQALLAAQLGQTLWPGAEPTGANGQAVLGDSCDGSPSWTIATCFSPVGSVNFQAPNIEALRYFDLFDRGYDPPTAISWMISNGYPTVAQWYPPPDKAVLGLGFFYLAARNKVVGFGTIWDIVIGLG